MGIKGLWRFLNELVALWQQRNVARLAAALAYYSAISIAPLLIIVLAIAGLAMGSKEAQQQLVVQMRGLVGEQGGQVVEMVIENADRPSLASLAGILGLFVLLWGATNVFVELQDALNTIWGVAPKPGRRLWITLRARLLSFAMVLVIGFLLLVSLVISTALTLLSNFLSGLLPGFDLFWLGVNFLISLGVITLLFGLLFKVLPDVIVAWRDVWLGAAVTALLFVVGKSLIGFYLGQQSFGSAYGAAGSLVVLLIWVFYSAQIVLVGAAFTQVYATQYGQGVEPSEQAQIVHEQPAEADN